MFLNKRGFNRTVISIAPREFHSWQVLTQPYPLLATLSNARTVAVREYHYPLLCRRPQADLLCGVVLFASFPKGKSWRTRLYGSWHKRNVSDFVLYCVAVLFAPLSFSKNKMAVLLAVKRKRGAARRFTSCSTIHQPEMEIAPHQSLLAAVPMRPRQRHSRTLPRFVVELPHGQARYVAAEMLQDYFHSVRVALLAATRRDREQGR